MRIRIALLLSAVSSIVFAAPPLVRGHRSIDLPPLSSQAQTLLDRSVQAQVAFAQVELDTRESALANCEQCDRPLVPIPYPGAADREGGYRDQSQNIWFFLRNPHEFSTPLTVTSLSEARSRCAQVDRRARIPTYDDLLSIADSYDRACEKPPNLKNIELFSNAVGGFWLNREGWSFSLNLFRPMMIGTYASRFAVLCVIRSD